MEMFERAKEIEKRCAKKWRILRGEKRQRGYSLTNIVGACFNEQDFLSTSRREGERGL